MGDAEVRVVVRKFDGSLHRHYSMIWLGEDEFGVWLGAPIGTVCSRVAEGEVLVTEEQWVMLIPAGAWWTALFLAAPARLDVYCDVTTPAEWPHTGEVTTVDLDLDVCRIRGDGSVFVDDQDEFAFHQKRHAYPPDYVARAETTAEWLLAAIRNGTEPFGSRYRTWLELVV
ncbi:protein associated with RNAse G/E [Streptacidiphilus sp. MAP12-20]|uniref:DUF402 domain-containing protein n=1 Tax=Streptacidiphilus sp. MAP12-20 TaxID=3156299 RepID=UPI0035161914